QIARKFGVSFTTIKKICIKNKIRYNDHTFWAKQESSILKNRHLQLSMPRKNLRKYDYQLIYEEYLKVKNYATVGRTFGINRSIIKEIIKNHEKYIKLKLA